MRKDFSEILAILPIVASRDGQADDADRAVAAIVAQSRLALEEFGEVTNVVLAAPLEELNGALVLLCGRACLERAEVSSFAGPRIDSP